MLQRTPFTMLNMFSFYNSFPRSILFPVVLQELWKHPKRENWLWGRIEYLPVVDVYCLCSFSVSLSFSLNISPLVLSILLPVIFAILSCHLYTPNKEIGMWYRSCQSYYTIYWPRVRHITQCMPIGVLHWDIYMKLRACQWNCLNTKRLNFVGFLMEVDKEWSFAFGV